MRLGEKRYSIDALPGSVSFWKALGFRLVSGQNEDKRHTDRQMDIQLEPINPALQLHTLPAY